jgi:sulfite reductase (NADPH) flavoprotein alpha-component
MGFLYFGYGSNMSALSLAAKGVRPAWSRAAVVPGFALRFNVAHFFPHEGGMGNIVRSAEPGAQVWGVLHACEDEHLALLDQAELHPHGYDRIEVMARVPGEAAPRQALAYVGTPGFIDDSRRPTRRYINILVQGARDAGLDATTLAALQATPLHEPPAPPPFAPPPGDWPRWHADALAGAAQHTALDGHVFDMREARWQHRLLWPWFGGKDMTLFHLRRMDSSDGREDEALLASRRYTPAQRRVLDAYLHAYSDEYRYAGTLTP